MSVTLTELENRLDKASAQADQRFRDLGVQLVEGETIDVDEESIIRTLAASGRGLPELKRLRSRLQHRKGLADDRARAKQILEGRERKCQQLAELRAEGDRLTKEFAAAMKANDDKIYALTDEISRDGHAATDLENNAVATLKSTAAPDTPNPWDWRNCSLDFSAPPAGFEGLPVI